MLNLYYIKIKIHICTKVKAVKCYVRNISTYMKSICLLLLFLKFTQDL